MKSFLIALCITGCVTTTALAQPQPVTLNKQSIAQAVGLPATTSWEDLELAFTKKVEAESCAALKIERWYCTIETISTPIRDERRLNQMDFQVASMNNAQADTFFAEQLKLDVAEVRELRALQAKRLAAMQHVARSLAHFEQARNRESAQ